MRIFLRLPFILSSIWFALSFISFYVIDTYNTEKLVNSFYSDCINQKNSSPDMSAAFDCEGDRSKLLKEWSNTQFKTPLFFSSITLGIFWIIGLLFVKHSRWTQTGD